MTSLFDPICAGDLQLASRVVMAPMTRNRANGSLPTAAMAQYYGQRADPKNGAALIISEATAICPEGQGYSNVPGLWLNEQVQAWQKVTSTVHTKGGTIVAQLWHVGRISHVSLQPDGKPPLAPSAIQAKAQTYLVNEQGDGGFVDTSMPRAMDENDIRLAIETYAHAAQLAIEAGFDGVEIHAANGYLIDQFLRSGSNHREDHWGGSSDNRCRFLIEVTKAVGQRVGFRKVGVRLSPVTPTNDAFDANPQQLFNAAVTALAQFDLAYVHIVQGQGRGARDYCSGASEFDYDALRSTYRQAGGQGGWMLNNGYDRAQAQVAIASQQADLISFGRPFIANPDLTARMRNGLPLSHADTSVYYGGGNVGYTDFEPATTNQESTKNH